MHKSNRIKNWLTETYDLANVDLGRPVAGSDAAENAAFVGEPGAPLAPRLALAPRPPRQLLLLFVVHLEPRHRCLAAALGAIIAGVRHPRYLCNTHSTMTNTFLMFILDLVCIFLFFLEWKLDGKVKMGAHCQILYGMKRSLRSKRLHSLSEIYIWKK